MATTINSTNLDFNNIKSALKIFLKQQSEFSDYDFEGAGLNNLLDVLSYNTHFNALVANFALNESFLTTAQLRSSVLSHAEALGYRARSITSSQAVVNIAITVPSGDPAPSSVTLPIGTKFSSTVAGVSYTFQTRDVFTADAESSGTNTLYKFKKSTGFSSTTDTAQNTIFNLSVFEGTSVDRTFIVGSTEDEQVYVIPDKSTDIDTLKIDVFDTFSSTSFNSYTDISNVIRLLSTSRVFRVQETPNGFYELIFGTDTGIVPVTGNKMVANYLKVSGADANGGSTFTPQSQLSVGGSNQTLTVTTVSNSAGGSSRESISSIKTQAPLMFASQQRLVTASDYRTQILNKYSTTVEDANAYGGEEATPAKYGVVYVALKFFDDISSSTQDTVKTSITQDLTDALSILSVSTEYVTPVTTFLELDTVYNLNPALTNSTSSSIENNISNTITTFATNNLKLFNKTFRRSNLLTEIDALDDAILNSRMTVRLQQRFTPTLSTTANYTLSFPVALAPVDDVNHIVDSTVLTVDGESVTIKNKLNSTTLQLVTSGGTVVSDNVGSYNPTTGIVSIEGLNPSAFTGSEVKLFVIPANQSTVRPLLNYVIDVDSTRSTVTTLIDRETTSVVL
jgi:hypothetical protein